MSGKNTTVYMTLQIKGNAGQEMKRIADQQVTATTKINQQWTQIGTAQARFVNTARAGAQATQNTARAGDQLLRTNKLIEGVLRNQTSQIKQHADYMKRVKKTSKNTKQNVQQTSSFWQKGAAVAGGLAGGYMTAKMVTAAPLERGRNFQKTIYGAATSITNGYHGMSHEQIVQTNKTLMQYAKDAVRQGHGTVEGVSEAAGILSASGIYSNVNELRDPLKSVAKTAFVADAKESDMARLVQQIKQSGVSPDKTQIALNRMVGSGYAGGFELNDMAQFLPEILAKAKMAGYSGEQGLNAVTTHLQLARKFTGTPGEAATNIGDLYNLFGQKHFSKAMGDYIDIQAGDPTKAGKKKGSTVFDLNTYLVNKQLQGIDTATAVAEVMSRQLSKSKEFNKLSSDLKNAESKKDLVSVDRLRKAMDIYIGGQFGQVFHNQQSLMGISALVTGVKNGDYKEIYDKSWNSADEIEKQYKEKSGYEPYQADALEQEKILAQIKIYESVNDKLGEFEGGLTQIMQNNQGLAAATIAATGALAVLANTAGGAVLGKVLAGGTGGAVATGAATSTAAKVATGSGAALGLAGLAYSFGQVVKPVDDYLYGVMDRNLFGGDGQRPDILQQYIEKQKAKQSGTEQQAEKTEQLVVEQQKQNQISQELSNKLSELIGVTSQNKPLPLVGGSLLNMISQHAATEEKRTGAPNVPFFLQKR